MLVLLWLTKPSMSGMIGLSCYCKNPEIQNSVPKEQTVTENKTQKHMLLHVMIVCF